MKRKIYVIIITLLSVCVLFTGCGDKENLLLRSRGRNIIKEEYDEQYNHYEDDLQVEQKATVICISGNVTSGTIDLKLIENGKNGNAARTLEYQITDTLDETIELSKNHSEKWVVVVDFNGETEGSYIVKVYK